MNNNLGYFEPNKNGTLFKDELIEVLELALTPTLIIEDPRMRRATVKGISCMGQEG